MRLVIQRVSRASVTVAPDYFRQIGRGLMVLVGVESGDTSDDALWLARKCADMRIFDDGQGAMNLSVRDIGGSILAISQFTLLASTRKGNRPSFIASARPEQAEPLYRQFCSVLEQSGVPVSPGVFGAHMMVDLVNDGPVTIVMDSRRRDEF